MRMLVTGGRNYDDARWVHDVLDAFVKAMPVTVKIEAVIHGGQRGLDQIAGRWARARHYQEIAELANWGYGNVAGPMRNGQMIIKHKPNVVVAFPGGKGTANMVEQARQLGVPVLPIAPRPHWDRG